MSSPYPRPPAGPPVPAAYLEAMRRCLAEAEVAATASDVPVGAVVLSPEGEILGVGRNRREADGDPTAHAEILALREAARVCGEWRLSGCTLVVTLEPCVMCAGAIVLARVATLVFGAWDPKAGAAGSVRDVVRDARLNHELEVFPGVLEGECAAQLRDFFATKR